MELTKHFGIADALSLIINSLRLTRQDVQFVSITRKRMSGWLVLIVAILFALIVLVWFQIVQITIPAGAGIVMENI